MFAVLTLQKNKEQDRIYSMPCLILNLKKYLPLRNYTLQLNSLLTGVYKSRL